MSMRERLLDAAEEILESKGLGALTVRELTRHAGVNLATVNYVFGTKDGLLTGLHERMFIPMTRERLDRFDALETAGQLNVRDIVTALIEPLERMRQQHGSRAVELYRYVVWNDDELVRTAAWQLLAPGMDRFESLIVAALPDLPRQKLVERVELVCQIAVPTALKALDPFDSGRGRSDVGSLIDFLTGGLERPGSP